MRKFLASVGNAQLLGMVDGTLKHIADVRTLTESSLSFSTTMEEVRAGEGAQLMGRFAHDSGMTVTLTDAMFDMDYIALQCGDSLSNQQGSMGGTGFYEGEIAVAAEATSFSIPSLPEKIGAACGLDKYVVWYRIKGCGEKDQEWKAVVQADASTTVNLEKATEKDVTICYRYFVDKPNARKITVKANFFPAECILLLTTKLFAGDANAPETGAAVGSVTVKIPRFQLDGQFDLSMAMSSAASMSLNGTVLATAGSECDGAGVYAEIVEVIDDASTLTKLENLIIDEDYLTTNDQPHIYGEYSNGVISKISNSNGSVKFSPALSATGKWGATGNNYVAVSEGGKYTYVGETAPASPAINNAWGPTGAVVYQATESTTGSLVYGTDIIFDTATVVAPA